MPKLSLINNNIILFIMEYNMAFRKTALLGVPIDVDSLLNNHDFGKTQAQGNGPRVNARGDLLGPGGKVLKSKEELNAEYQQNLKSQNVPKMVSLGDKELPKPVPKMVPSPIITNPPVLTQSVEPAQPIHTNDPPVFIPKPVSAEELNREQSIISPEARAQRASEGRKSKEEQILAQLEKLAASAISPSEMIDMVTDKGDNTLSPMGDKKKRKIST